MNESESSKVEKQHSRKEAVPHKNAYSRLCHLFVDTLVTFTGRKSGKEFTTPMRYVQEGETLRLRVVRSPWWKNLVGQATVHVLLRGEMRTGTAEVLPEEDGEVVVKVHLTE